MGCHGFKFQTAGIIRLHVRDLAAHFARGLPLNSGPLQSEGAGNAGHPMRPQPRVRWWKVKSARVSQVTPESPGIPRAMVLTASFVLLCPRNLPECANGRFSPTARRWI